MVNFYFYKSFTPTPRLPAHIGKLPTDLSELLALEKAGGSVLRGDLSAGWVHRVSSVY